jgi:DNA-directed RNA polymerase beta subunit/DNA-directed RNA polymerase beta' subunit
MGEWNQWLEEGFPQEASALLSFDRADEEGRSGRAVRSSEHLKELLQRQWAWLGPDRVVQHGNARMPDAAELSRGRAFRLELKADQKHELAERYRHWLPVEPRELRLHQRQSVRVEVKPLLGKTREDAESLQALFPVTLTHRLHPYLSFRRGTIELPPLEVSVADELLVPWQTPRQTFRWRGQERVLVPQLRPRVGVLIQTDLKSGNRLRVRGRLVPEAGPWLAWHVLAELDPEPRPISCKLWQDASRPLALVDLLDLLSSHGGSYPRASRAAEALRSQPRRSVSGGSSRARRGSEETWRRSIPGRARAELRDRLQAIGIRPDSPGEDAGIGPVELFGLLELCLYLLYEGSSGGRWSPPEQAPLLLDDPSSLANLRIFMPRELLSEALEHLASRACTWLAREAVRPSPVSSLAMLVQIQAAIASLLSSPLSQVLDRTNPLAEVSHRSLMTLGGPRGVPRELKVLERRRVHPSQFGVLCPAVTPESMSIGLDLLLARGAEIRAGRLRSRWRDGSGRPRWMEAPVDRYCRPAAQDPSLPLAVHPRASGEDGIVWADKRDAVLEEAQPGSFLSAAAALIPFVQYNDPARILMGAKNARQAVPLDRPEQPLVATGLEDEVARLSGRLVLSGSAGAVKSVGEAEIVVEDEDGTEQRHRLEPLHGGARGIALRSAPRVAAGDRVRKGQLLADAAGTRSGKLALGVNLLVAYMPYKGWNFADAFVVGQHVIDRGLLRSTHCVTIRVPVRSDEVLGASEEERRELLLDGDGVILPGSIVRPGSVLVQRLRAVAEHQGGARDEELPRRRPVPYCLGFPREVCQVIRVEKVPRPESGIRTHSRMLQPVARFEEVRILLSYVRDLQEGDKLMGRFGNKGVVGKILPAAEMPRLPDGTPVDLLLNPHSVVSRMNLGQLLETHYGLLLAARKNGELRPESARPIRVPPFRRVDLQELEKKLSALHVSGPDGTRHPLAEGKIRLRLGADENAPWTEEPVTVGYQYFFKLNHLAADKIAARSTGPYEPITRQAVRGRRRSGGQRLGEMELWALCAHRADKLLRELLGPRSDASQAPELQRHASPIERSPEPGAAAADAGAARLESTPNAPDSGRGVALPGTLRGGAFRSRRSRPLAPLTSLPAPPASRSGHAGLGLEGVLSESFRVFAVLCRALGFELKLDVAGRGWIRLAEESWPLSVKLGSIRGLQFTELDARAIWKAGGRVTAPRSILGPQDPELSGSKKGGAEPNRAGGHRRKSAPAGSGRATRAEASGASGTQRKRAFHEAVRGGLFCPRVFGMPRRLEELPPPDEDAQLEGRLRTRWGAIRLAKPMRHPLTGRRLRYVPVAPVFLRPVLPDAAGSGLLIDPLNHLYGDVLRANADLKSVLRQKEGASRELLAWARSELQRALQRLYKTGDRSRGTPALIDYVEGKQGILRKHLLGRRVDFSGRAIIVPGPELHPTEVGLPPELMVQLLEPQLRSLVQGREAEELALRCVLQDPLGKGHALAAGSLELCPHAGSTHYDWLERQVARIARRDLAVLLNRAPSLHKYSLLCFRPRLVPGCAIRLHPLYCEAYNADFDGDTMAVFAILDPEAAKEALERVSPWANLFSVASGRAIPALTEDMITGLYLLGRRKEGRRQIQEVLGEAVPLPEILDKAAVQSLTQRLLAGAEQEAATGLARLHRLMELALDEVTRAGLSISVFDLAGPDAASRSRLLERLLEEKGWTPEQFWAAAPQPEAIEAARRWYEQVREQVVRSLSEENPVGQMVLSGARGNPDTLAQLAGLRGPMSGMLGPLRTPVRSNIRDGLEPLDFYLSCHGARKTLTDKKLKVADAGALTRRIIEGAYALQIVAEDCGNEEGIPLVGSFARLDVRRLEQWRRPRLAGRLLGRDLELGCERLAQGAWIDEDLEARIPADATVWVRSPVTCAVGGNGICRKCYGWDLSRRKLVEPGQLVGLVAGQSIGERGTQLSLQTFHSGGVLGMDITQGLPRVQALLSDRAVPVPLFELVPPAGREALGWFRLLGRLLAQTCDGAAPGVRLEIRETEERVWESFSAAGLVEQSGSLNRAFATNAFLGEMRAIYGEAVDARHFEVALRAMQAEGGAYRGLLSAARSQPSVLAAMSFQGAMQQLVRRMRQAGEAGHRVVQTDLSHPKEALIVKQQLP